METIVSFFRDHILTYSVFAALGILATFGMSLLLCVKREQNWVRQLFLMIGSLLGLVLGAKLFGIVSYATYLMRQGVPVTFEKIVFQSGIVFYGGLLGYFGSFWLLSKYLSRSAASGATSWRSPRRCSTGSRASAATAGASL